MKKLIFLQIFLLSSYIFAQDRWVFITSTDYCKIYIDSNSIHKDGNIYSSWQKTEYFKTRDFELKKKEFIYDSEKIHFFLNCTNNKVMFDSKTYYLNNKIVYSIDDETPKWNYIIPESIGEKISFFLCGSLNLNPEVLSEPKEILANNPVIGERIKGPANIYDSINGKVLFSLNANTRVAFIDVGGGWAKIGVTINVSKVQMDFNKTIYPGVLSVNGIEIGRLNYQLPISGEIFCESANSNCNTELCGFTKLDNINSNSIIENVFSNLLDNLAERDTHAFESFIENFNLTYSDYFYPLAAYFNNENRPESENYFYRTLLLFNSNKLIGFAHSREINIPNTTEYKLLDNFSVTFFNDTREETIKNFIKKFNIFVKSVN